MDSHQAQALIEQFAGKRVAVVGDLMLDRYIWGKALRISQEAPVPVVRVRRTTAAPGGAANVLRNVATLGAQAVAFGVLGDDAGGRELQALLAELGVDPFGLLTDANRRTTEKTRIIASHQQVVRVDTEDDDCIGPALTEALVGLMAEAVQDRRLDAIIVEDYGKGLVSPALLAALVELGRANSIPVALDPHPGNPINVPGLALFTPNRAEAFALAGVYHTEAIFPIEDDPRLLEVVEKLQQAWRPECLLITLGSDGMALFREGAAPLHIPTQGREVYDVSGAGDTVVTSFMLALVCGASSEEAAVLSNHAAGVVVGKVGTAPVYADELLESFEQDQ